MTQLDRDRWQVLEPLLDQALDLASSERGPWLDHLRTTQPELAGELARLLDEEGAADQDGFLSVPPEAGLAGVVLGAYRLERPLGYGGMGTVWLAHRCDGRFEGQAAVKILNLALLPEAGQERFRREGSVLARLSHPGIARLLDVGVGGSGQPYLVLEYVDGVPIDRYVVSPPLSLPDRLRVFLQVLAAVGHAHAHLVLHRDLKPSNILVAPDGTVKLLDFGIAKLLDDESAGLATTLTLDGGQVLTPRYAAPEQLRGEALTTATDVYALGVLLYLLLSGRHPTSTGDEAPPEIVQAVLEREPAPLGLGDLDLVLGKALRKVPAERYHSAEALAEDIGRVLRNEPVQARTPSAAERVRAFVTRYRTGLVVLAPVTAGLLAGASTVG
jgi:serine/threonine protein kinase